MLQTQIMIIGAGPSGLMLSAQLHRLGVEHTIADKKQSVTSLSKALAVQARTLEQYRQLGIVDAALSKGFMAKQVQFIADCEVKANIPLGEIGLNISPYPYMFVLEQSENEKLLKDYIESNGGHIRWSEEVSGIRKTKAGYAGQLLNASGLVEEFECKYLVDCGGASGIVRKMLQIPFEGNTNENMFFVADIYMDTAEQKQGLTISLNEKVFVGVFPMSGKDQYRVIGVLPPTFDNPEGFSFEDLKSHIEANIGIKGHVTGHSWYSAYKVHHRIAERFQEGNAFLVGDAAHIHSPAGGQGMNTGFGDAVNLGWKLAAAARGWSDPKILSTYEEERRPVGLQLVHTTDRAFGLIVSKKFLPLFVFKNILPHVMKLALKFKFVQRTMFKMVSQTRVGYRNSTLSDHSRSGSVRSGDRYPWFEWDGGDSFEAMKNVGYVEIRIGGAHSVGAGNWSGPFCTMELNDVASVAAVQAGLPKCGTVLVRPDMHIQSVNHI